MAMSDNDGRVKQLSFSNQYLDARWITDADRLEVDARTIVVNISTRPIVYSAGGTDGFLLPFKSTILQRAVLRSVESAILIKQMRTTNIGGSILGEGWRHLHDLDPSFSRSTPLWLSSQDDVGHVDLDPRVMVNQADAPGTARPFDIKVNLWFSPAETDCVIHTGHKFLEVHTQVYGTGHMQKFVDDDQSTLYEDVYMTPGLTHQPFPIVGDAGEFEYPWHRYYSDTDCIWMAIELHVPGK
jgi:hypothetical protein